MARRTGTEPQTARSPLRLRMVLAGFGLIACTLAAVSFLIEAQHQAGSTSTALTVAAAAAGVGALVAIVDLAVLGRRWRVRDRKVPPDAAVSTPTPVAGGAPDAPDSSGPR